PGDRVVVPRFGYDRPGRIIKIEARKKSAVVAIGQMQWDVAIDELIPQMIRTPDVAAPASKGRSGGGKPGLRLEDFADDPAGR
ncbi:endonuclease MutS2, partial [Singulisphaera rosea]